MNYFFRINVDDTLLALLSVLIVWKQYGWIQESGHHMGKPWYTSTLVFHFPFWLRHARQASHETWQLMNLLCLPFFVHALFDTGPSDHIFCRALCALNHKMRKLALRCFFLSLRCEPKEKGRRNPQSPTHMTQCPGVSTRLIWIYSTE